MAISTRFFLAAVLLAPVFSHGQMPGVLGDDESFGRPSEMMGAYLKSLADQAFEERKTQYDSVESAEEIEQYQQKMKSFFVERLGGFPERTPLNARIVGEKEYDGFRLQKVIYESLPGFPVTAALYLPLSDPPYPGVLVPCGHSSNGKAAETYQRTCILLARNGMAALCYDPIGQGERYQILDDEGKPRFGSTLEHTMVGVGSILVGRNTAGYRIWDGIRGIDYLVSRDDIDADRIGCTGNSGGGTLTSYIMALDDRVKCAAPSCYLTSLERLIATIGPQDAEQDIYGQIAYGMDHAEYILMRAPKPTLICAATEDFFDIGGTWDTFREAKRFYTRLDYPERVDLVETDQRHGFSEKLREGAVHWMRRWLMGIDEPVDEPEFDILSDAELQCTDSGQVMLMDDVRSVIDFNTEAASDLEGQRKALWDKKSLDEGLKAVRALAGIRPLESLRNYSHDTRSSSEHDGYSVETVVLEPEPGVLLPAYVFTPDTRSGDLHIFAHGEGKANLSPENGLLGESLSRGDTVVAVDLRGIGETGPTGDTKGGFAPYFGIDWTEYFLAYLMEKSYVGMRAEDILTSTLFALDEVKGDTESVHLTATGEAAIPALHAAALEPQLFESVRLEGMVESWVDVVQTPITRNQLINTVHGALRAYDLPDLVDSLPAGTITLANSASPGDG